MKTSYDKLAKIYTYCSGLVTEMATHLYSAGKEKKHFPLFYPIQGHFFFTNWNEKFSLFLVTVSPIPKISPRNSSKIGNATGYLNR